MEMYTRATAAAIAPIPVTTVPKFTAEVIAVTAAASIIKITYTCFISIEIIVVLHPKPQPKER
jgi:hypothetical protein